MSKIEIYTDGAYSPSREKGGWAYVIIKDEEKIYSDYGGVSDSTNNRMEITAVLNSIIWTKTNNISEFTIYTDSMYVIGTMTKNWKKKKNTDLWEKLERVITSDLKITWKHVKGHSDNKWNNHCDLLAVHGSELILNN